MNGHRQPILWSLLLVLTLVPSALLAQTSPEPGPRAEADSLEEDLGFGYRARDGAASLALNHSAVFCPDPALLVVDRSDEREVQNALQATDLGNGTWAVPDPETGETVVARVQYAGSTYGAANEVSAGSTLPRISPSEIVVLPLHWNRCWRIRRGHLCGVQGNCGPAGCLPGGYSWAQLNNFLVCRWTGNFFDRCLESLRPVCRLNRHRCRDCTGGVVASFFNFRWVCAVF
jgi:hypothetical protein